MTALPILLVTPGSAGVSPAKSFHKIKRPGSTGGPSVSHIPSKNNLGSAGVSPAKVCGENAGGTPALRHDYVLTPGRYVGAEEEEDNGIPFSEKMEALTAELKEQFAESARLEAEIKKNLAGIGYEC